MRHNVLTTRKVETAKGPARLCDGMGLYLQVSRFGTKAWVYRYDFAGKTREMGLGSAKAISLKLARELGREQRELLLKGEDPIEVRRAKRDRVRALTAERITFREAAEQFIAVHSSMWKSAKHRLQWNNTLRDYVYHSLGTRPVSVIDGALITETLAPIWQTKIETASRVKQRIERIIQWVKDGKPLPHLGVSKRVKHLPALQYEEAPAFMAALRQYDSMSARALELTILTVARTSDTIEAKWKEVDFKGGVWTVSDGRHKTSKIFEIPLCRRAIEILKAMPRINGNAYIFAGRGNAPISSDSMAELLKGMHQARAKAGLPPWADKETGRLAVVHGFRSTFRDWAGDRSVFPREVVEAAMSHQIRDKAEAAYRRGSAIEKRRKLMESWCQYCETTDATVTQLRRA